MAQRSIDILLSRLKSDPDSVSRLREDPLPMLEKLALDIKEANPRVPPNHDKFTYRLAVAVLSMVVLIVVSCVATVLIYSSIAGSPVSNATFPEILVAIGSAALGALAGLLAPIGSQS